MVHINGDVERLAQRTPADWRVSCVSATFVLINPMMSICMTYLRERSNGPRGKQINSTATAAEPRATSWLVCALELVSLFTHPRSLLGESSTAPRGNNNLEHSKSWKQHDSDPPMELHDPYGELSFAEIVLLVRSSLPTTHEPPMQPQNQTQDPEAHTRTSSLPRKETKSWGQVILTLIRLIFLWFQMLLPSIYFLRVSRIIKKSGISMADYSRLKQPGPQLFFLKAVRAVGAISMPNIDCAHSMRRFRKKWKEFVEQCVKEWKNLNIVSALLLR